MNFDVETDFKGRIRYLRSERKYIKQVENAESEEKNLDARTTEFDENGNKVLTHSYNEKGNLTGKTEYTYDEAGQLVYDKSVDDENIVVGETFYSNGLKTERRFLNPKFNIESTSRYLYDTQNRLIYAVSFSQRGVLTGKTEINYDSAGRRTEKEYLEDCFQTSNLSTFIKDANNFKINLNVMFPFYFKAKYGADNNPIAAAYYDKDKKIIKKYEFDYGKSGFIKELREFERFSSQHPKVQLPGFVVNALFSAAGVYYHAKHGDLQRSMQSLTELPMTNRKFYSFSGDKPRQIYTELFGQPATREEFKYGENGELLSETFYDYSDKKWTVHREKNIEWEFDERGNWIKKIFRDESPFNPRNKSSVVTITRTIEYFD
jgi:hypothetical protein